MIVAGKLYRVPTFRVTFFPRERMESNHLPLGDLWEADGSGSNKPLMRSCTGLDRIFHLGCFSSVQIPQPQAPAGIDKPFQCSKLQSRLDAWFVAKHSSTAHRAPPQLQSNPGCFQRNRTLTKERYNFKLCV